MRVEELMGKMAVRIAQEVAVQGLDLLIHVGLALRHHGVFFVQSLCTQGPDIDVHEILCMDLGLSSAAYAAA